MNPEVGFQLPLSGSLFAHNRNTPHPQQLTFNSLSRDHEYKGVEVDDDGYAFFQLPLSGSPPNTEVLRSAKTLRIFQLPLSGSPIAQRAIQRIVDKAFQLPLSGSPSPIPGFPGSPRLPAAAPLRTSVFFGHYLKI